MAKIKNHSWPDAPDYTSVINQKLSETYFQHHSPRLHMPPRTKYIVLGDRVEEVKEFVVHSFSMGDVEDPDLYAAQPLYEWEKSDIGQWVMKNAADTPTWHRMADAVTYGYRYQIRAKFVGPSLTEYLLRSSK